MLNNDEIAHRIVQDLYAASNGNTLNKYTMYYWTEEAKMYLESLLDTYYPEKNEGTK